MTKNPEASVASERVGVWKTYKLYIGGAFPRTESGRYYRLENADGHHTYRLSRARRRSAQHAR